MQHYGVNIKTETKEKQKRDKHRNRGERTVARMSKRLGGWIISTLRVATVPRMCEMLWFLSFRNWRPFRGSLVFRNLGIYIQISNLNFNWTYKRLISSILYLAICWLTLQKCRNLFVNIFVASSFVFYRAASRSSIDTRRGRIKGSRKSPL